MAKQFFWHQTDIAGRLDQIIAKQITELSRTQVQSLIKNQQVKLNGEIINVCRHKVKSNDIIEFSYLPDRDLPWVANPLALDIIFEDDDLLIINKPAGLVMHPGAGNKEQTVANALLHYNPLAASIPRAGIVHRLDKGTSGICMCAKTNFAYLAISQALQNRAVTRKYNALVHGELFGAGCIEQPIARHPKKRTAMAVVTNGKYAKTSYRVVTKYKKFTWLELTLATGRTHQIRVHMEYFGHPIVADPLYNRFNNSILDRQALHAFELSLMHPRSKKQLTFTAKVPEEIISITNKLDLLT